MKIAVPTMDRVDSQVFVNTLPVSMRELVHFYAPEEDCAGLRQLHPQCKFHPTPRFGIAKTRQFMLEDSQGPVLMVDDDVSLTTTVWDDEKGCVRQGTVMNENTPEEWELFLDSLSQGIMQGCGMVGVTYASQAWQMARRDFEAGLLGPTRTWSIYAVNPKLAKTFRIRFDKLPCMEDFDFNLQMLRSGVSTGSLTKFCWTQRQSNADGGCSGYRTFEVQKESAEGLKARHPNFVRVVKKKAGWGNGLEERYDTVVQWAKAGKAGKAPVIEGIS